MATNNRHLQPSIRPLRSEYRVVRDHESGRMVYTPFNDMNGWDYLEFACNICTCFLLTFYVALLVPVVNGSWPVFGAIWIGLCIWQNESWIRWPVRFIAWGLFWGAIAIT